MSKHTPGPWFPVLNTAGQWDVSIEDSQYAQCVSYCYSNPYIDGEPEANARLTAAAPDLLEALEAMLGKAYKQNWNDNYPDQVAQAQAAVDKARGES